MGPNDQNQHENICQILRAHHSALRALRPSIPALHLMLLEHFDDVMSDAAIGLANMLQGPHE